jgi:HD-GYP domain-containing protein (c-di-GMP phosphodiesterase class II)
MRLWMELASLNKSRANFQKLPFLAEAGEIIYAHHERFDGTGYPRMLKGEQIPLGARIVVVANALDSITSDQPYIASEK